MPLLPAETAGLVLAGTLELLIFGVIFMIAWSASRASREELLLRWREGFKPVWRGFLYSILLRLAVIAAMFIFISIALGIAQLPPEEAERFRARTEAVVDAEALQDPAYLAVCLTLISFVVAGFREELWRAGMLAGLGGLFPAIFGGRRGGYLAAGIAALIFGLGHWPQGVGGATATAFLGFGLGVIMVYYRSIWEAVLAHGFFNATSFLMLYFLAQYYPEMLPGV
jgi:membrane protease YdiL (CAAX protease family)